MSGAPVPGKLFQRASTSQSVKYAQTAHIQEFLQACESAGKAGVATNAAVGRRDRSVTSQEPYLQHILGFIGFTDIAFIHAENQAGGQALASMATAGGRIEGIVAQQGRRKVAQ